MLEKRLNHKRICMHSHLIMIMCMTVFLGGILFVKPVLAKESGKLLMTIVANVNVSKNQTDFGHSFLVITNNTGKPVKMYSYKLKSGESASISLRGGWPSLKTLDGKVLGGAYINAEMVVLLFLT